MPNIKDRIYQILKQNEPLDINILINKIFEIAYNEDKITLDKNRIKSQIESEIKNFKIIYDENKFLLINTPKNMHKMARTQGIVVKHVKSGQEMIFGSPGVIIGQSHMTIGDFQSVEINPNNYYFVLDIDLPMRINLNERKSNPFKITVDGKNYNLFHIIKHRGEENFSIQNIDYLPYFSSLQINGTANKDIDFNLVTKVLSKLNVALNDKKIENVLSNKTNLPFEINYIDKQTNKYVAQTRYFLTTDIEILGKDIKQICSDSELENILNSEKFVLQNEIEENKELYNKIDSFEDKILKYTHDFSFYARQSSEIFSKLQEENIRDLYNFGVKVGLGFDCEAEVQNYDGKSDFKIKNPLNKYEYIIGELKWWIGEKSISELCTQAFEKHVTGQEKNIYMLMLSKNKDIDGPLLKSINFIKDNYSLSSDITKITTLGSKEHFYEFWVNIKGEMIKVYFAMLNLYHSRV